MGLNVTNVFIHTACDALKNNISSLTEEQREELCDKLVELTKIYSPGTFKDNTTKDASNS